MSPKNIAGIKAAKQIAIEATKGTALVSIWNRMMNNAQLTRSRYEQENYFLVYHYSFSG
jgi:hypothetical protein